MHKIPEEGNERRRVMEDRNCPYCGKYIEHLPGKFCPRGHFDYCNVEYSKSGKKKQYFHRSCYMLEVKKNKQARENQ